MFPSHFRDYQLDGACSPAYGPFTSPLPGITFSHSSHLTMWSLLSFLLNSEEHLTALSLGDAGTSWAGGQALGRRSGPPSGGQDQVWGGV